ncbi:hypothetical protein HZS_2297 [Henneguya salminicola]|nr:hypothetical protein HZS_2297 [Henneguya salminicola]
MYGMQNKIETDLDKIIPKLNEISFDKTLNFENTENFHTPLFNHDDFFDDLSYDNKPSNSTNNRYRGYRNRNRSNRGGRGRYGKRGKG